MLFTHVLLIEFLPESGLNARFIGALQRHRIVSTPIHPDEIMTKLSKFKPAISILLAASIVLQPLAANAALHQLSFVKVESATLETFDFVSNTDWDYDANPPAKSASGQSLDRAYITAAFAQMAKSTFTMTEGRHRVGTVYVYPSNRFGNRVDIKMISLIPGRSNATVSRYRVNSGTSTNYLEATAEELGKVMAHENGHYVYGLMDEYREAGKPLNPNDNSDPSEVDTPLNTLMNNQAQFSSLSTAADNVAPANTANRRFYDGASAWEVLSRPLSSDSQQQQRFGSRTAYPALAGLTPATPSDLTRPITGWDGAFKVVFVNDPLDSTTYVMSRTVRTDQLAAVKNAVAESIRKITLGPKAIATVVTYGGNGGVSQQVYRATLLTEEARTAVLAAVEAITVDTVPGNLEAALAAILTEISGLYTSNLITLGDGIGINVFAGGEDNISVATRDRVKELRVAINANIITDNGIQPGSSAKRAVQPAELAQKAMRAKVTSGTVTLAQLAHASGGHFTDAHKAAALSAGAVKAQAASGGALEATLSVDHVDTLAAGAKFELKTPVLAKTDGKLTFNAYWDSDSDSSKIRFELTAPDGTKYTPANPLVNQTLGAGGQIKYVMDAESANASFEVASAIAGKNGLWISTITATAALSASIEQDVIADSTLRAELEVQRDGTPNPTLTVQVSSNRAVINAVATALIYDADGSLKLTKTLLDDGTNGDARAGDGTYSASLGSQLPAGQYDVVVVVTQGPNGSLLSTSGLTVKGVNAVPEPLGGAFSRVADTMLTVAPTMVVEYYVPALKKYVITGLESDKAMLAQNPALYPPTGMSFVAGPGLAPPAGTQPICRYYFAPPLANTHFYGAPSDCTLVASTFASNRAVTNEGISFAIALPDAKTGTCPASAPVKVYRSFNNRSVQNDGNHRYTVSAARYNQMIAAGYSADGAVFCAASATDAAQ